MSREPELLFESENGRMYEFRDVLELPVPVDASFRLLDFSNGYARIEYDIKRVECERILGETNPLHRRLELVE